MQVFSKIFGALANNKFETICSEYPHSEFITKISALYMYIFKTL